MISVEQFIDTRFPELQVNKPVFFKTAATVLKQLFHESEFQQFEQKYPHISGFDFVEQVLDYFDFKYSVINTEKERIPLSGRVVIVSNHPIGSLDGLALLKLVSEVRKDVKVVANEVLSSLKPLAPLLFPVDNMNGRTTRQNIKAIHDHLNHEGAVIFFPAGEVSRLSTKGIRDGKWNTGFLKIATSTCSPILPIYVDGRNSTFFYSISLLAKPLSTLWLVDEMFKQSNQTMSIYIGNAVPMKSYQYVGKDIHHCADLFKQHVYRLQHHKKVLFPEQVAVAHPEPRQLLRSEIRSCKLLGKTQDNKQIYLYDYEPDSSLMREIGRLRELSFRAVGEGTGKRRDTDHYDANYQHIILWDDHDLEIVGSYRIADSKSIISKLGICGLYSSTLFEYQPGMQHLFERGLELGRSFIQPRYWGLRSLDYLWYGIGAYLRVHPHIRYLFGPVSISNEYSGQAKTAIVNLYQHYFSSCQPLAIPRSPFKQQATDITLAATFNGNDYKEDFAHLKSWLGEQGLNVPTLYKQYVDVCEQGGVQFAGFNIDPDFSNCIDGLVIVDLVKLKTKKRERYLGNTLD